tara:strand:- start:41825 stop:42514 length:690 start_codon:yes stop_codon:yes gene_type:complete
MGLAWGVSYNLTKSLLSEDGYTLKNFNLLYFSTFVVSWIGAKALFLSASSENMMDQYLNSSNFWLGGGFVFYGGLLFGLVYLFVFCKLLNLFSAKKLYLFIPGLTFGHAIGRVGCFLAGCCYGTICELPWAIDLHDHLRHPVQLYEALSLGILGFLILKMIKFKAEASFIVRFYLISYSIIRFILEYFRGDKIRGVHDYGTTSQYISLIILSIVLIEIIYSKIIKRQSQ